VYRLILVDDEPWALTGLAEIIPWDEFGFELCGLCKNGAEALTLFERENADAVFTDIRMPGMSGVELIAGVKKIKAGAECVIVSAYSDFEAARKALEYHASGYLLKPLEEKEVRETAARLKARLDDRKGEGGPLLANSPASLAQAVARLETVPWAGPWRRAVLYETEKPVGLPGGDWAEIRLPESALRAGLISAPEKTSFRQSADAAGVSAAYSRWRRGNEALAGIFTEMLVEASASGCGGFIWANHHTVSEIQLFIALNYRENLSLGNLASRFSVSENYLGELFKKHSGQTVTGFIRAVRLENARRLLEHGGPPTKEIADECGFWDISYFGRSFRQRFGIAPAQYQAVYAAGDIRRRPDFFIPWLRSPPSTKPQRQSRENAVYSRKV
jgi:two-component system response regulator YesN